MSTPCILIIATSHARMGAKNEPTGAWLEELTTPYYRFVDAGADVIVASIAGGAIPIDPRSTEGDARKEASVRRYLEDADAQALGAHTRTFTGLDANHFDALFLPGGHGTMWDCPNDAALASLGTQYVEAAKPVAAVRHGPAGLTSARAADGTPAVAGRRLTGFTNGEEAVGLTDTVPFLLEDRLRELGANYEKGADFAPYVVRDGVLITGQNPATAANAADLTLDAVRDARR